MTARAQLDAYARSLYLDGAGGGQTREECAPAAFDAIRAVLAEHILVDFGGSYGKSCQTCRSGPALLPYPTPWPCPTVKAITAALEAS